MPNLYLTPADQGRAVTLEEFERAGYQEGYQYELIWGKVEVAAAPNFSHDRLVEWVKKALDRYAEVRPDVINYVSGRPVVFVPDQPGVTRPEPDVTAFRGVPLDRADVNWQDFTPVVVVEVLSPDTVDKDIVRNVELYRQVPGLEEYWVIDGLSDLFRPTLTARRKLGRRRWRRPVVVPAGGVYETPTLPGLALPVDPTRRPAIQSE